ncbi:MAG: C-GCAxxG-C-C family (seleno)protein [Bacilli bacterium]
MKEIDIKKIGEEAYQLYINEDYYCSEAVVYLMQQHFDTNMPDVLISSASGFPVGVGANKCICGAITGGVISLGYFFGRSQKKDDQVETTITLADELIKSFKKENKVTCCSILTKGMDMQSGDHKEQCASFTALMAKNTATIIARELGYKIKQ